MIKDSEIKNWYESREDKKKNSVVRILDVDYAHIRLDNNDDIYFTGYGLPFIKQLNPENFWFDKEWYKSNSQKLSGTSSVYKVRTKKVNGISKDIILKWNRMGQEVPGVEIEDYLDMAEFNSPFEEFSLVMELRHNVLVSGDKLALQKPLAIYSPAAHVDPLRLGRKDYKMKEVQARHLDVELDMCRAYAMIYEWIKGVDAATSYKTGNLREYYLKTLTLKGEEILRNRGFTVRDRKPHHIIIRYSDKNDLIRDKRGRVIFGMVDYELLERQKENAIALKHERRENYLIWQRDRFEKPEDIKFYPHLSHENIFGVDYIYGEAASTKGRLWVVGNNPQLFDYFLPEKWEHSPRQRISRSAEMYHTETKDNIHIVWKISNVGIVPDMDPFIEEENCILQYGYNSPFEKFSAALELSRKGVPVTYPRAIYMAEKEKDRSANLTDNSRFESHKNICTADGKQILMRNRDYIIIWGFWNGPDEKLAISDSDYYEGINAIKAFKEGIITKKEYISFMDQMNDLLKESGYMAPGMRGNHIIISIDNSGHIVKDSNNKTELRLCNFDFIKKI